MTGLLTTIAAISGAAMVLVGVPVLVGIAVAWRQQTYADQARDTAATVRHLQAVKAAPIDRELADRLATSRGRNPRR